MTYFTDARMSSHSKEVRDYLRANCQAVMPKAVGTGRQSNPNFDSDVSFFSHQANGMVTITTNTDIRLDDIERRWQPLIDHFSQTFSEAPRLDIPDRGYVKSTRNVLLEFSPDLVKQITARNHGTSLPATQSEPAAATASTISLSSLFTPGTITPDRNAQIAGLYMALLNQDFPRVLNQGHITAGALPGFARGPEGVSVMLSVDTFSPVNSAPLLKRMAEDLGQQTVPVSAKDAWGTSRDFVFSPENCRDMEAVLRNRGVDVEASLVEATASGVAAGNVRTATRSSSRI